jgi:anti-sigma-K factor RskA
MNERIDELIALAALGEISTDEQRELDQACAADPRVALALRESLEAATSLHGVQPVTPPPTLRGRVLDAIAMTPQEGDAASNVVSIESRRRRPAAWLSIAAAVAVLGIVAVTAFALTREPATDRVAAVVDADDVVERQLSGSLEGTLTVSYSPDEDAIAVVGAGLADVPDDATLQLWLVGADGPTSVGVFRPDEGGAVSIRFDDVDPTDVVLGVTLEPAGGSEQPTLPILASA